MNNSHDEPLLKPKRIRFFKRKRAIYIPCDSSRGVIYNHLKKINKREIDLGFGRLFFLKDKIVAFQSVGAPAAVLLLEPLIVSGATKIIILGFCGSLNPSYKALEAVTITKSFSEEGTSSHYFNRRRLFHSSSLLRKEIEQNLTKKKLPFKTGTIVSTDAPYRETKSWLTKKQKNKIDLVDMETSAVFALAEFYRVQAAALMIISDELFSIKWRHKFTSFRLDKKVKEYFIPFIQAED